VVENLEPRRLIGTESQGMLVLASNENNLFLIIEDKEIEEGT